MILEFPQLYPQCSVFTGMFINNFKKMPTVHRRRRKALARKRGTLIILMICRFVR